MNKLAHLWLGFEGALLIVANESFDSFALVIGYALEEFSSEVCVPQNRFKSRGIPIDVPPKKS